MNTSECITCRFIEGVSGVAPPPPPAPEVCTRIATNQRGALASLIEPAMVEHAPVLGLTSSAVGLFEFYAYAPFTTAPGAITWEYTVTAPNLDWEIDLATAIFGPNPTWADVQTAITAAAPSTRIIMPASLPNIYQPLVVSGKEKLLLDFSNTQGLRYTNGDSPASLLNITGSQEIVVIGFNCVCQEGSRRQGIRIVNSTDIDIRSGTLFGCTDGIKAEAGASSRVRFSNFSSLNNVSVPDIFGAGTDSGYGAYLGDVTDLILDSVFFEAGASSGQHGCRIPNPTRVKIVNSTFRVVPPASKRSLWIFGARQIQLTNVTCVGQRCDLGVAASDGQGTPEMSLARIDGFISNNCAFGHCINFRCDGGNTDFAMRNAHFNNPQNPSRVLNVDFRDDGDVTRDLVWIPSSCSVNGGPFTSSNWRIEPAADGGWTPAEALARNIGPLVGVTEYQQYIVMHGVVGTFTQNELLRMNGEDIDDYRARATADGGTNQQLVNCATGLAAGEIIPGFIQNFPPADPTISGKLHTIDVNGEIDSNIIALYLAARSGPDVVNTPSGTTAFIVEFLEGTPGRVVLANITLGPGGIGFMPGDGLFSPAIEEAGLALEVGNPTNQQEYP